jgi:hypothetical protein
MLTRHDRVWLAAPLGLWLVAAFLGALVVTHYLLARVLAGDAAVAAAIPVGWSLL